MHIQNAKVPQTPPEKVSFANGTWLTSPHERRRILLCERSFGERPEAPARLRAMSYQAPGLLPGAGMPGAIALSVQVRCPFR